MVYQITFSGIHGVGKTYLVNQIKKEFNKTAKIVPLQNYFRNMFRIVSKGTINTNDKMTLQTIVAAAFCNVEYTLHNLLNTLNKTDKPTIIINDRNVFDGLVYCYYYSVEKVLKPVIYEVYNILLELENANTKKKYTFLLGYKVKDGDKDLIVKKLKENKKNVKFISNVYKDKVRANTVIEKDYNGEIAKHFVNDILKFNKCYTAAINDINKKFGSKLQDIIFGNLGLIDYRIKLDLDSANKSLIEQFNNRNSIILNFIRETILT